MIIRQGSISEMLGFWDTPKNTSNYFVENIRSGNAEFWTAELDDKLIGELYIFKHLSDDDYADGKSTAYLCAFRIIAEMRGKGYGTKLMKRVFERLEETGFSYVTIGVEEREQANIRLYKKLGFVETIKICYNDPCDVNENFEPLPCHEDEYLLLRKAL